MEAELHTLSTAQILFRIGIALLLVAANGFFVAAEFALVSTRKSRIQELADQGDRRARFVLTALGDLNLYLSSSQLGITLASLALGWVAESTLATVLIQAFRGLPSPWNVLASHAVAGTLAFVFITFLHIVLGEQAPKTFALTLPEKTSLWAAGPLVLFTRVLKPFIAFLNASSNFTLRRVGLRPMGEAERVHRPEEIELLVAQMFEHGVLAEEPVDMIRGVFDLSETTAEEIMTPRTEMVAVEINTSVDQVADLMVESGHSRFPVFRDNIDHIVGVVLARDVWRAQKRQTTEALGDLVRSLPYIPQNKSVETLLREMQVERVHMAVVLDEYGGTAGLVTVEDLLEQIVGDIRDEHEQEIPGIEEAEDGLVRLAGSVPVADLNERYSLDLPENEYTTVAGYVMGLLGRVAIEGEDIAFPGGRFHVLSMSGRRIKALQMLRETGAPGEE